MYEAHINYEAKRGGFVQGGFPTRKRAHEWALRYFQRRKRGGHYRVCRAR